MTVAGLNLHIATLQTRLLVSGNQLDAAGRKAVEKLIAQMQDSIKHAEIPHHANVDELVHQAMEKTDHIKAPDFTALT